MLKPRSMVNKDRQCTLTKEPQSWRRKRRTINAATDIGMLLGGRRPWLLNPRQNSARRRTCPALKAHRSDGHEDMLSHAHIQEGVWSKPLYPGQHIKQVQHAVRRGQIVSRSTTEVINGAARVPAS